MKTHQMRQLLQFVAQHTGLEINEQRQAALAPFLEELLDKLPLNQLIETLSDQTFTHPNWQHIIQAMTIGETYFFRNQFHFAALRDHVLPELIRKRRASGLKQLRIWVAGCSTGEEAYSISILLRELIPDIADWSISLLATDINEAYLAYAKHGIYHKRSFRNETPDSLMEQWFTPTEKGVQVSKQIQRSVVFSALNLVSDDYPSYTNNTMQMDLITCRNVTIYFDAKTTRQVAERFYRALSTDGWLLVGHSEPNSEIYKELTVRNFENAIFYQKCLTQAADRPVTQATRPENLKLATQRPASKPLQARASKPVTERLSRTTTQAPRRQTAQLVNQDYLEWARDAANKENWSTALELLNKAEEHDSLNPYIHYLRGLVYEQLGNLEVALQSLQRAIYCDADFALGHYSLGHLYATIGEERKAVGHWRSALQALGRYQPDYEIPFSDGLTVEMLNGLISYRLG